MNFIEIVKIEPYHAIRKWLSIKLIKTHFNPLFYIFQ
ncbi:hypothetical protein FUAX_48450 (plasmid) [Fulvitalea axinellae]|uniref:Uncharacterized protein n=1 Tax=Fulvitalea axinellae TaxID=1182444 RepID=A0AAU9D8W2_9BACT|nr:hypothetical protein FUAX_48450 [Fulvitalea axinellae]